MLSWQVGDVRITRILELEATGGTRFILPQATPDAVKEIGWLSPHFADENGKLRMSIHALVVETPTARIVVDTCIGNDKQRDIPTWSGLQTNFLADLAAAGFPRESIDVVLCTHLHVDHVGWNTMLESGKWVPTFPNARYLLGRDEFEYWRAEEETVERPERSPFHDSVQPVWDAGLVELVATDHQVCPEVALEPTLGHTPGHVSVRIRSKGAEALITGDFIHHPCQFTHPEWASLADYDPAASTATRARMFADLAGTETLVIGTHFTAPTAGHVVRDGAVWRLAG
ncbi:MAG TPA: MBL fold metallo-hydrolase [Phenylobacterium sp.]|jgi:glyoxylase-like metal-dependent hydrolase (beta-lactamase superfamily II)|uniref:MBL fold metallo-hydrolase n=1 Tax=Phenylobacterium sp. TaxID=1871053 RepID=UPI002BA0D7B0|nr:MBL fold metallo-hydrolase [Phenylobacterium sp.]HXA40528.1 MBL fold metallo-hydrolase [Phenylobacterium sp.]